MEALTGWGCPRAPERRGCQRRMGVGGATHPQPGSEVARCRPRVRMRQFVLEGQVSPLRRRPEPSRGRERMWSLKPRRVETAPSGVRMGGPNTADNLSDITPEVINRGFTPGRYLANSQVRPRGAYPPQWDPEVPAGRCRPRLGGPAGPGRVREATPEVLARRPLGGETSQLDNVERTNETTRAQVIIGDNNAPIRFPGPAERRMARCAECATRRAHARRACAPGGAARPRAPSAPQLGGATWAEHG